MNISMHNNMLMMGMYGNLNIVSGAKAKTTEKLSSGYRVNRAADDAASLAISEKMRTLIRALKQGSENAQDGVSWTQTGDGALEEASEMIHRMNELAIKSLNDTNTEEDRAYMEAEFNQLQSELDRLSETTTFNTKNIFSIHDSNYSKNEGSVKWDYSEKHMIREGQNELTFVYQENEDSPLTKATITVPRGSYTTQELSDEIDSALEKAGFKDKGINFEINEKGICSLNYEGGKNIDSVYGSLSYLLNNNYQGGSMGALLGTTIFPS